MPSPSGAQMATEDESSGRQCPDGKGSGTETCRARGPQKPSFVQGQWDLPGTAGSNILREGL